MTRRARSMYGVGLRGKATRLHSLVVRARGFCQRCGSTQNLQAAHIVGRRYTATRTDENNAWCLCATCHFRTGEHADDFMLLVDKTIGRLAYDQLKARALAGAKSNDTFWLAEATRLQALLDEHGRRVA